MGYGNIDEIKQLLAAQEETVSELTLVVKGFQTVLMSPDKVSNILAHLAKLDGQSGTTSIVVVDSFACRLRHPPRPLPPTPTLTAPLLGSKGLLSNSGSTGNGAPHRAPARRRDSS